MDAKRINVIFFIVLFFALIIIGRLYYLQVVRYKDYANEAKGQYSSGNGKIFERGSIYLKSKDGSETLVASLKSGYTIYINPTLISNPDATFEKLSRIYPFEKEVFYKSVSKKSDPYEEIAWKLDKVVRDEIKVLDIDGVYSLETQWRYYPGKDKLSHALGFVGFLGDDFSGRYGLERYYNDTLARNGDDLYTNFFADIFSNIKSGISDDESSKRGDLVLTIEPDVQDLAERKILELEKLWKIEGGGILIMEPKTGAIRGMAVYPSYDLNKYNEVKDISVFPNKIVERVYEVGSSMKAVTMAAGIDSGAVNPTTTYLDKGSVIKNGKTLSNFDGKGRGVVDMQTVLDKSLNTGSVFIVEKMGNGTFKKYLEDFGFGDLTGIDLPNEVSGLTENLESDRDVEFATASFGQGIAVTPIEMARAVGAIANGGFLMKPYIVDTIKYDHGIDKVTEPVEQGRILKRTTSETVSRMLVHVVDEAYQGGNSKLPNYSIAGKTGTAQMVNPLGGYYEDKRLHSFVGYFPAYDPKFLVYLYLENPKGIDYSSQTLVNPFMDIAKFLINLYNIPPDR